MTDKIAIGIVLVLSMAWHVYANVNCTETGVGRFASPGDATCQNYILCVYNGATGIYSGYNYVCPDNAVFDPNRAVCTAATNYVCNVTTNITTSVCKTGDDNVADPKSTNCTGYIVCVQDNSTYIEGPMTCPDDTYFNPTTTYCEYDYKCTIGTPFTCTEAGRFADTTDTSCRTYHFCALVSNGTYAQHNYACPSTSVFNPNSKLCTLSYTCTTA